MIIRACDMCDKKRGVDPVVIGEDARFSVVLFLCPSCHKKHVREGGADLPVAKGTPDVAARATLVFNTVEEDSMQGQFLVEVFRSGRASLAWRSDPRATWSPPLWTG